MKINPDDGFHDSNSMVISISTVSVSMSKFIPVSVAASVTSLTYLSCSLMWDILADLFRDWMTFFYRYFKWNLS